MVSKSPQIAYFSIRQQDVNILTLVEFLWTENVFVYFSEHLIVDWSKIWENNLQIHHQLLQCSRGHYLAERGLYHQVTLVTKGYMWSATTFSYVVCFKLPGYLLLRFSGAHYRQFLWSTWALWLVCDYTTSYVACWDLLRLRRPAFAPHNHQWVLHVRDPVASFLYKTCCWGNALTQSCTHYSLVFVFCMTTALWFHWWLLLSLWCGLRASVNKQAIPHL